MTAIFASRRRAYVMLALVAALPRLVALAVARGDILESYVEKSDDFARTFVATGTYGLIPGEPSAYTQPLYGWFLVPLYWLFGRHWPVVGLAQVALAVLTAVLVYELGRRFLPRAWAGGAAAVATLNPYLVWHDVHVNREIVDQPLAVGFVLLALVAADRRSPRVAAAAGAVAGLAILGNARLVGLPLLLVLYLAWRWRDARATTLAGAATLAACAVVLTPWVARNEVQLGCATITTDSRALWKANNVHTLETLRAGKWIDDVPNPPDAPPSPQMAAGIYHASGRVVEVDECAQMRDYQDLTVEFWREHPGEKARLAALAVEMTWDPRVHTTTGRSEAGGLVDHARAWAEPVYLVPLYALALVGVAVAPRAFSAAAVGVLAYTTLLAAVFVGTTRYRVPWDFLIVLLAAAAARRLLQLYRRSRLR